MTSKTLETLSVVVSGSVFSLLLYENVKYDHGQDGFLLGKIEIKETKNLTDADNWVIKKENQIKIKSAIPCPEQFHFYDSSGKINGEKIKNFLGHCVADVVGWYVYRPTRSTLKLMLREKIVHKQLAQFFQVPDHHFSCGILITEYSANKSTHSLSQTFVRYNCGTYDGIPFHISNLSDPICMYKTDESSSDVVNTLVKNVMTSDKFQSHCFIKNIHEVLQLKVKDLLLRVSEKEQILFELERDVKALGIAAKNKKELIVDVEQMGNGLSKNSSELRRITKERNKLIINEP